MPFKVEDVDKHKKGLKDKHKKQWVEIANSVMKSCMDDGGEKESCAVSAIKQANGKMNDVMANEDIYFLANAISYSITKKKHQGKDHIVVPVVMMVEGVHNNNRGKVFYATHELSKVVDSWNGVPVTINHPYVDGVPVSANSPELIDAVGVGRIYNAKMVSNKLMAEAWIEEEKIKNISPAAYSHILQASPLEVSTGLFSDNEEKNGDWNGEEYNYIAKNHRPDHLALLPGGVGACSWQDGCGIRTNSADSTAGNTIEKEGEIDMAGKPCCPGKVELLIQRKRFEEPEREMLLTFNESVLDKLLEGTEAKEPPVVNQEQAVQVLKDQLSDPEKLIQLLPEGIRESVQYGLSLHQEERNGLIAEITANAKDVWSNEELIAKPTVELKKIAKTIKPVVDYSGLGGGGISSNSGSVKDEPMLPYVIN